MWVILINFGKHFWKAAEIILFKIWTIWGVRSNYAIFLISFLFHYYPSHGLYHGYAYYFLLPLLYCEAGLFKRQNNFYGCCLVLFAPWVKFKMRADGVHSRRLKVIYNQPSTITELILVDFENVWWVIFNLGGWAFSEIWTFWNVTTETFLTYCKIHFGHFLKIIILNS